MVITLEKFGTTLTSRQFGKESWSAFRPSLDMLAKDEEVIIDFLGVDTFSPSWGDEFLTPLTHQYKDRVIVKNTDNASVKETLTFLEEIRKYKFRIE